MRLRIGQRQGAAPGAAEQQPALDAEEAPQRLDVGDQVRGGVVAQLAQRAGAAGAALVEDHHAPMAGVEEAAMHRAGPGARAAVQKQRRLAARVAHLLPVHDMAARERQQAGLEGRDIGEEVAAGHRIPHILGRGPRATAAPRRTRRRDAPSRGQTWPGPATHAPGRSRGRAMARPGRRSLPGAPPRCLPRAAVVLAWRAAARREGPGSGEPAAWRSETADPLRLLPPRA